jgi:hypothetical protein
MGCQILKRFYSCNIKNILTGCIKALQRVVCTGAMLPAIQELYTRQCQRKALKIVKDSMTPAVINGSLY